MVFDFQTMMDNAMAASRANRQKNSPQMLLGEMIAKLESVSQDKNIVFDFDGIRPCGLDSWRGIYAELAISWEKGGETKVADFLADCKDAVGSTFQGYKGGDFQMGKSTSLWISNYGDTDFGHDDYERGYRAPISILETDDLVVIQTDYCPT